MEVVNAGVKKIIDTSNMEVNVQQKTQNTGKTKEVGDPSKILDIIKKIGNVYDKTNEELARHIKVEPDGLGGRVKVHLSEEMHNIISMMASWKGVPLDRYMAELLVTYTQQKREINKKFGVNDDNIQGN